MPWVARSALPSVSDNEDRPALALSRCGATRMHAVERPPTTQRVDSDIEGSNGTSVGGPVASGLARTPRRVHAPDTDGILPPHSPPHYLRSDNGAEFTARAVREWLERVDVKTLYIEPARAWLIGYIESF